ncbi:unnamed protein product [Medioppia subpectinata]|uniref:C2H2-type domain-containing protein n=1 Tax=Medioppia subpectinata TaxID=1979941 RepID=A0A7R9Q5M7_9ACAR|nr:unnamed protein product [Medioppia subpectinata]CAG2112973.1 unnamed protein product [Medioppia subpectinata]
MSIKSIPTGTLSQPHFGPSGDKSSTVVTIESKPAFCSAKYANITPKTLTTLREPPISAQQYPSTPLNNPSAVIIAKPVVNATKPSLCLLKYESNISEIPDTLCDHTVRAQPYLSAPETDPFAAIVAYLESRDPETTEPAITEPLIAYAERPANECQSPPNETQSDDNDSADDTETDPKDIDNDKREDSDSKPDGTEDKPAVNGDKSGVSTDPKPETTSGKDETKDTKDSKKPYFKRKRSTSSSSDQSSDDSDCDDSNRDDYYLRQRKSPQCRRNFWWADPQLDQPFQPEPTADTYLLDAPKRVAKRRQSRRSPSEESDDSFINDGPVDVDYEAIARDRNRTPKAVPQEVTTDDDDDTDSEDTVVDEDTEVDERSDTGDSEATECEPQYVCLFCDQRQRLYCEAMDHMISHFPEIMDNTGDYGVERRVRSWCKKFLAKQSAPELLRELTDETEWSEIMGSIYCPVCERVADTRGRAAKPFDTYNELKSHVYKHSCWAAIECGLCHKPVDNTACDILQHLNAQHKHSLRDSPVEAIRQLSGNRVNEGWLSGDERQELIAHKFVAFSRHDVIDGQIERWLEASKAAQVARLRRQQPVRAVRLAVRRLPALNYENKSDEAVKSLVSDLIGKTPGGEPPAKRCRGDSESNLQTQANSKYRRVMIALDSETDIDTEVNDNEDINSGENTECDDRVVTEEMPSTSSDSNVGNGLVTTPAAQPHRPSGASNKQFRCGVCHSLCDNRREIEVHVKASHPNRPISYRIINN